MNAEFYLNVELNAEFLFGAWLQSSIWMYNSFECRIFLVYECVILFECRTQCRIFIWCMNAKFYWNVIWMQKFYLESGYIVVTKL
jgi:hypothetical protein